LKRLCQKIFTHVNYFHNILQKILWGIAHNVPAVYDGLTARIRALRSKDQGWQTVAEVLRGNEQSE
jgi:hypothetical protein